MVLCRARYGVFLTLSLSWQLLTVVDAANSISMSNNNNESPLVHRIDHSHKFNIEPRAIITSVLRDITEQVDGKSSLLDIDVSSNRLGDSISVSLMEEILPQLETKMIANESQIGAPRLITLAFAANNLSPIGASKIFNTIMKKKDETLIGDAASEIISTKDENDDSLNNTKTIEQSAADIAHDNETPAYTSQFSAAALFVEFPSILIEELDLSFNDIGGHGTHAPSVQLQNSVQRMFEGERLAFAPRVLTLQNCGIGPLFCRSVGRGILNSFERQLGESSSMGRLPLKLEQRPSVLRIGGNSAIGDAGTVALAAALRMAMGSESGSKVVLEELDLSSCNVGDAGAEALAIAIALNPDCLRRLNLSNNKITNAGARAIGMALMDARLRSGVAFEEIILDGNIGISDDGAAALAEALGIGAVKSLSLRSCSLQAQGATVFGRSLVSLINSGNSGHFSLDLSGNHFGNRKIAKKKGTATRIRDSASTNMKFIGKTLKGAAKRFGSEAMGITADSDDDEEVMGGLVEEEEDDGIDEEKVRACGGHAFASELISNIQPTQKKDTIISIGMRQCLLDSAAINALSASIVATKNCELSFDVSMNVVDDATVEELLHPKRDSTALASMAERHMDYMDTIADARLRQREAVEAASRNKSFASFVDDDDDEEDFYDDDFFD